jgi:hypothetical protein
MPVDKVPNVNGINIYWQAPLVGDEIMSASPLSRIYSVFTLALLEDTGWYKPDISKADNLLFGYGE